jgi:tryptophan-rich sensory protein
MILRLAIFLAINLGTLGLGSLLMGKGSSSEWYQNLEKAPWTPPGWTFGAAWLIIMICFAFYMAYAWINAGNTKLLILLFFVQLILNVAWNPVFFYFHFSLAGLIIIIALTSLVGYFLICYMPVMKIKSFFILPYFIWLLVATTLNGYIVIKN